MKEKILEGAGELFMRLGIRSVTMDDVARSVAVSKKTLYQYFENKDALVTESMLQRLEQEKKDFLDIEEHSSNAIEELHKIAVLIRQMVSSINPSVLYDIEKYHRNAWDHFMDYKHKFVRGYVERNIVKGISEGYYREEIDAEIIATLRDEQVQLCFNPKAFPLEKFQVAEVQMQIFDHFVHGLLTDKGRELYYNYQKLEAKSILT
ncbi:MAG: TetR/AcrR family transcriptional regulator [Cyclobacteriaceae bacterium]|nr:TetR/AcrR family transcriptional regulator [Cyclobacteriaceae bacterium HetDA_MAG_MS6]